MTVWPVTSATLLSQLNCTVLRRITQTGSEEQKNGQHTRPVAGGAALQNRNGPAIVDFRTNRPVLRLVFQHNLAILAAKTAGEPLPVALAYRYA